MGQRVADSWRAVWHWLLVAPRARTALIVAAAAWIVVIAQLVFFALFQPIWSPIDEFNHFFYINYLNYAHRPPALYVPYRGTLDPSAPAAQSIVPSYGRGAPMQTVEIATEGLQPPAYYTLMTPIFRSSPHGTYEQVTRVRLATAALAALVVPLIFVLGRLAAPGSPWVWGAASVLPAVSRGYSFNLSQVTNDALAVVVGSVALLIALWLMRSRLHWRWGLVAGLTAGMAAITKVTVYFVLPLLLVLFVIRLIRERDRRLGLAAAAAGIGSASVLSLPWFLLNLYRYHSIIPPGGATPNLASLTNLPLRQALETMVQAGSLRFWVGEGYVATPPAWLITIGEIGLILCALGFVLIPFSQERPLSTPALVLGWLVGGLAVMFAIVLATHVAVLNGRYLYPLFAPIAIVCAVGADRIGRMGRWLFAASTFTLVVATAIGLQLAVRWSLNA